MGEFIKSLALDDYQELLEQAQQQSKVSHAEA